MAKRLKVKDTRSRRGQVTVQREEDEAFTDTEHEESVFCCKICDYVSDKRVKCKGFCGQCNIFLCKPCIDKHNTPPASVNHTLLQGARMPKRLHAKQVKYSDCALHMEQLCDCYCLNHKTLICRQCEKDYHNNCNTQFIPLLCRRIGLREAEKFKDSIKHTIQTIKSVKGAFEENMSKIEEQKNQIILEASTLRDVLIEKINTAFEATTASINAFCKDRQREITERMSNLSDIIEDYEASLAEMTLNEDDGIVPSEFLRFQAIGKQTDCRTMKVLEHCRTFELGFFSIFDSPQTCPLEEWMKRLGTVKEDAHNVSGWTDYLHVRFPDLSALESETEAEHNRDDRQIHVERIQAVKKTPVIVRARENDKTCDIWGMSVTASGSLLIIDNGNGCVRIVSPDKCEQSPHTKKSVESREQPTLALPDELTRVAVIDDKKAVVLTRHLTIYETDKIYILNISDEHSISVLRSLSTVNGYGYGICPYKNYLILHTHYDRGVKMVDYSDPELQSVATARSIWPKAYVLNQVHDTCGIVKQYSGTRSTVAMNYRHTIVTLDANDGTLINTAQIGNINSHTKAEVSFITTDNNGNVYGSVFPCNEIRVWSPDLQESRTVLREKDFQLNPMSMVYKDETDELYISYRNSDSIDCFQLIM